MAGVSDGSCIRLRTSISLPCLSLGPLQKRPCSAQSRGPVNGSHVASNYEHSGFARFSPTSNFDRRQQRVLTLFSDCSRKGTLSPNSQCILATKPVRQTEPLVSRARRETGEGMGGRAANKFGEDHKADHYGSRKPDFRQHPVRTFRFLGHYGDRNVNPAARSFRRVVEFVGGPFGSGGHFGPLRATSSHFGELRGREPRSKNAGNAGKAATGI